MELDELLMAATAGIGAHFFNLPIGGGDPIYRERVYCYELYHQLRSIWPEETNYVLNGEIDKRGHPIIHRLGADLTIPDLLVHVPGYMENNLAIIEVKPGNNATPKGVAKDLTTLSVFQSVVGYERGIYLFYGQYRQRLVRTMAGRVEDLQRVEVWLHPEPGHPAEMVDVLGETRPNPVIETA